MDIINIKFYKTIDGLCKSNIFEMYKMKIKNKKEAYLSIANNKSKCIQIYKINSKDDFKLIHTIKIDGKDINEIKYFYNKYTDTHYLTALVDDSEKIYYGK